MASSKVMSSRSPTNQDPSPENLSSSNFIPGNNQGPASVCMDDLLRNLYSDSDAFVNGGSRDVRGGGSGGKTQVTLEDFLVTAGMVNEEDVRVPAEIMTGSGMALGMDSQLINPVSGIPAVSFAPPTPGVCVQNGFGLDFPNGVATAPGGRGKRRVAVEDVTLDKATQQKQRRMIKNRESAARSRERKQAHTVELESLVAQLEDDNARILRQEAEGKRERYKKLMKMLIPVTEKPRPSRILHRTRSVEW